MKNKHKMVKEPILGTYIYLRPIYRVVCFIGLSIRRQFSLGGFVFSNIMLLDLDITGRFFP